MKKLILAVAVVAAALFVAVRADTYKGFGEDVFIDIPRGTSAVAIGTKLEEAGVIRHRLLFPLARLMAPHLRPQAGEYRFSHEDTAAGVLARMARGDVYVVELVVKEGEDVFDIAENVERLGLARRDEFIQAALPMEGYLFPSTYRFKRSATAEFICQTMRRQFDTVWRKVAKGAPSRETVILASLVETEAVVDDERARIAGVYSNRLRIGMKLDCDPTVAYAAKLNGTWRGTIYKDDLSSRHAYNTYVHPGLPPGPVANPGEASLRAALKPAESKDLFFVASSKGDGSHLFSESFAAHERAVAAYRRAKR